MSNDDLDNLLQQQIDVCGAATEFAITSAEMLKKAVIRIQELEAQLEEIQKEKEPKKKSKSKKKKKK